MICENWNWTMSPGAALMSFGVKARDLFSVGEPTTTLMILLAPTLPAPVPDVAVPVGLATEAVDAAFG